MPAKDFLAIIRPFNCAMAAIGTFIGYSVASGTIGFELLTGIAMAVAFLVCAGGMAINDYFDRGIDAKMHPKKPIPSGRLAPKAALIYTAVLFLAGLVLAFYYLPAVSLGIAIAFTILLIIYSMFLSKAKFVGNFVVASGTAFTLIFGASLAGYYSVIAPLALAALFANLARELIKDLEDVETDKGFKKTLPMMLSEEKVDSFIFLDYAIAIVAVYIPVALLSFGKPMFVIIVSIANFIFLYSFSLAVKKDYARAQLVSKAAMFIALLGFLLGVCP